MNFELIFEEPQLWGLRGDPVLWQEMKEAAIKKGEFKTEIEFSDFLNAVFKEITENKLVSNKIYYVKRLDTGGMSRGRVECDFWIKSGFPLLISRFNLLNK
ncbi:hypothetical protein MUGA111182_07945 [Mucilaginibacter galii]|uniref:Uncharacterized protein n=1 Tax=Mucilaginibacter galii TaxID=2005073 RepID=A0A917N2G0_9SPHI|nr:hypothetical protein [Mucilaginibacter galii]GGI51499.1 hypothetical protein GCM10011425_27110 [Mucilaginibacter galii]